MLVKICSIQPETLWDILRINSPNTRWKDVEGGSTPVWLNRRKVRPETDFARKLSHATPKAVAKVSMLRDVGNRPILSIKRRRRAPLTTNTTREKEELHSKEKHCLCSAQKIRREWGVVWGKYQPVDSIPLALYLAGWFLSKVSICDLLWWWVSWVSKFYSLLACGIIVCSWTIVSSLRTWVLWWSLAGG